MTTVRTSIDLIREDFRRGHRHNTRACMIERGLERVKGGKWIVGDGVTERSKMWPGRWQLGDDGYQVMGAFDSGASMEQIFRGQRTVRVTLIGEPMDRPARGKATNPVYRLRARSSKRERTGTFAAAGGLGALALIGDGMAWVLYLLASVALVTAGTVIAVKHHGKHQHANAGSHEPLVPQRSADPVPEPARRDRGLGERVVARASQDRDRDVAPAWVPEPDPYRGAPAPVPGDADWEDPEPLAPWERPEAVPEPASAPAWPEGVPAVAQEAFRAPGGAA